MFKKFTYIIPLAFVLFLNPGLIRAQAPKTVISGIVVDSKSGSPLYLAEILIEGTVQGTTTDQNGSFSMTTDRSNLSLRVSRMGYNTETVKILNNNTENLRISLSSALVELKEVVFKSEKVRYRNKNNPAVLLIDSVVAYRNQNRIESFDFLKYGKYEKTQFALSKHFF